MGHVKQAEIKHQHIILPVSTCKTKQSDQADKGKGARKHCLTNLKKTTKYLQDVPKPDVCHT